MGKLPPFERPSIQDHKQQRFWQIILPIVLFSALVAVAGCSIVFAGAESDRLWADISIIWLLLPVLVGSLILLALLVGSVYLMARLLIIVPNFTRRVQNLFHRIEKGTHKAADSAVKPVLWILKLQNNISKFWINLKPGR